MMEEKTLDNIAIAFDGVTKSYEAGVKVLDDIHLQVKKGEMITLIGPSGCGKTTLIKLINHLMDWDHGDIWVMGKRIYPSFFTWPYELELIILGTLCYLCKLSKDSNLMDLIKTLLLMV